MGHHCSTDTRAPGGAFSGMKLGSNNLSEPTSLTQARAASWCVASVPQGEVPVTCRENKTPERYKTVNETAHWSLVLVSEVIVI